MALGSITTNKASESDEIPAELFQVLKDDAVKVLHSICQQIWQTQKWPQDWKRTVFILSPKKDNAKKCSNYHTVVLTSTIAQTAQNPTSEASTVYDQEFPDVQAGKVEEQEIKLPTSIGS